MAQISAHNAIRDVISGIVANLIEDGESIDLSVSGGPNSITVLITVNKTEIPKIIGKQGKNIQSLKILCSSIAAKNGYRFNIVVNE